MDETQLRAEMMTFINDSLHDFQEQPAVNTRNHVQDALKDLRQTLPTLVSTAVSTEALLQATNMTLHLALNSPEQDHQTTPLSGQSAASRHIPRLSPNPTHFSS